MPPSTFEHHEHPDAAMRRRLTASVERLLKQRAGSAGETVPRVRLLEAIDRALDSASLAGERRKRFAEDLAREFGSRGGRTAAARKETAAQGTHVASAPEEPRRSAYFDNAQLKQMMSESAELARRHDPVEPEDDAD